MGLVKTKRPAGMKPQMKSGAGNGVQHVPEAVARAAKRVLCGVRFAPSGSKAPLKAS